MERSRSSSQILDCKALGEWMSQKCDEEKAYDAIKSDMERCFRDSFGFPYDWAHNDQLHMVEWALGLAEAVAERRVRRRILMTTLCYGLSAGRVKVVGGMHS